jgi:predicted Zn-dependent protease
MRPVTRTGPPQGIRVPYVGARPFELSEAAAFFGRVPESAELARLWQARRLTVLSGASGVGKTSLLRAGTFPRLVSGQADILPIGRIARAAWVPQAALAPHNPYTLGLLASWSPAERHTELAGMTVRKFLRRRPARTDRYGRALPVLAAVDQAEDLFRLGSDYGQALIEELIEALDADPRLRLLLSVREEYMSDLIASDKIFDAEDAGRLRLMPLAPEAAIAAIRGPVENSGRSYASGIAEALADDLRSVPGAVDNELSPAVEPALLQVACAGMWESLPESELVITGDHIRSPAGVDGSLDSYVGRVLAETADDYELPAADLHSWLRTTFRAGRAVDEGPGQTEGMPNPVLHRLQDRYLLKAERESGVRRFRLQHNRLIGPIERAGIARITQPSPEISMLAAKRAWNEGDLTRAERHARRVIAAEQEDNIRLRAEAESIIGNVASADDAQQAAADHYRKAAALFELAQDTGAVSLLLAALGWTEMIQDHRDEAIDAMQSAVARTPEDPGIQTALAHGLREMNKDNAAVSVLAHVLAAKGDTLEALRVRSEIMAAGGDAVGADRDRIQMRMGQAPRARAARALVLAAAHELNAAEREIGSVLAEAPDNGPVLLYAAQIQVLRGDAAAAAELTSRAIAAAHPPLSPGQRERAQSILPPGTGEG